MEIPRLLSLFPNRQYTLDWTVSNLHTAVTLAAGLVSVRLLTRGVSLAEYGFWLTAGNIAGYLLMLQRGTSAALMRSSAEAWARKDPAAAAHSFRQLTTLMALYAALGGLASGVAWLLLRNHGPSLAALVFWTFLSAGAAMTLGAANAYLSGLGWYSAGRMLLIASSIGNLILTLVLVGMAAPLWVLAASQTMWTLVLGFAAGVLAFFRICRIAPPQLRLTNLRDTLRLLYSGMGFLLTDLGYLIAYQSDNVLIGLLLGPAFVVPLSLMQRIASTLHTILGAQHSPLLPALMKLKAVDATAGIRVAYLTQMRRFGGVALIFAWGICCYGRDAVSLWVGAKYYCGWAVNFWVAVAFLTVALYRPTGLTLCAMGQERRCGKVAIVEAVANVCLSVFLILKLGVAGTVMATAVTQIAVTHIPLLGMLQRRLKITVAPYLRIVAGPWILPSLLLATGTAVSFWLNSPLLRLSVGVTAGTASLIVGWRAAWASVTPVKTAHVTVNH